MSGAGLARSASLVSFPRMPHYVALLRGIGPSNPAMHNHNLQAAFESAGLSDVEPVLASGNLVFTGPTVATKTLERRIEDALNRKLGLTVEVLVRRGDEVLAIAAGDPFDGAEHGRDWYLTVTFFKDGRAPLFSKFARATLDGPEMMREFERRHGRHITTRTWATVQKLAAKLSARAAGAPAKAARRRPAAAKRSTRRPARGAGRKR